LGRPSVVLSPDVGAGFEDPCLGRLEIAFPLQMKLEKRQLDVLAVERGGLGVELHVPREPPSLLFQPPCSHGPMTSRFGVAGLVASTRRYVSMAPKRFSASNQPPTVMTAGLMFLIWGRRLRAFQNSS